MLEGNDEICEVARGHIGDDSGFDLNFESSSLEHDYLSADDPMLTGNSLTKPFDADARLSAIIDDVANADVPQFIGALDDDTSNVPEVISNSPVQQKWLSVPPSFSKKKATVVRCEYCGVVLKHPSKIEAHRRTHTGEKPFECQICGLRFTQRTPMRMHVRRHMGLTPYMCSWGCGKRFVSNALKNAHELKTHIGAKRRGPPCPHLKPPKRSVSLKILEGNGDDEEAGVSGCRTSPNEPRSSGLDLESRKMDEVIERVVTCSNLLESEQKVKTRRKKALVAQCQECGLLLKHPSKIQAHMRTHTGERPFECGLCGMRFATANPLRVHFRRAHTGEKPYECTWDCGRRFVSISARNEHERIVHAGIKRYHCSVNNCHRMFTRRRYLTMHQIKEHRDVIEQADNAIQCVLNMVKQEREARRNTAWPSEEPVGCVEKMWTGNDDTAGQQSDKQFVDNSNENGGDAALQCTSIPLVACTDAKEKDELLNGESCQQIVIDGTSEDVMSENYFVEPAEVYYLNQMDEGQHLNDQQQQPVIETSVSPGLSLKTERPNIDTVCEESTTVLPKYGRIRIIKPITKKV